MTISNITAIIVNRKTRALTESCLTSLLSVYPDINVLLVDNRSGNASLDYVKTAAKAHPNVRCHLITTGSPHHARGLKEGVAKTTTPYFLTLDSDVVVLVGGWLEKMLQAFASDPKLLVIGHLCRNAGKDCIVPPKANQPKFNFVHPFCALWHRARYNKLGVKFAHTGQPACYVCIKAEQKGYHLANIEGIHPHNMVPDVLYVRHVWGGTRTRLAVLHDEEKRRNAVAGKKSCIDCGTPIKKSRTGRCRGCASKAAWADPEIRERRLAPKRTPEFRRKLSEAVKVALASPETRRRMSESAKKLWEDPDFRRRHSEAVKAACADPEVRHRTSIAARVRWSNEVYDAANENPETRRKRSEGVKAAWARGDLGDDEWRRKSSEWMKAAHARGDFDHCRANPSKLELNVVSALEDLGLDCVGQYRPEGCSYVYDILLPHYMLLVEVDGTYWHSKPGSKERDNAKDEWAIAHGFDITRFPEEDIMYFGVGDYVLEACKQLRLEAICGQT